MVKQDHSDIPHIALNDYIPSNHFRTIVPELRAVPHGRPEISVVIEFSKESTFFKTVLPAFYNGMMYIYGYVHDNEKLKDIFSGSMAEEYEKRHISLYDWKDKFLVVFENGSKTMERQFIVSVEDVWNLLRNCYHPTEI
ncbi:MAG: hypothetical protein K0R50_866 [Eubacterium sp.]|jgi:hypothetical protein|nr:hypothetical protein [Eubacterium sp.]